MDALNGNKKYYFTIASFMFVFGASAAEIHVNAGVESEYINQTIDDNTNNSQIDSDNLIFSPYLSAIYNAKRVNFNLRAEHNHVSRSLESNTVKNNYTNYSGRFGLNLIDNFLRVTGDANQGYRGLAANSFIVDDFLLNAENLAKTNSYRGAVELSLPAKTYFGIDSTLSYSNFTSDNQQGSDALAFDNERYLGRVNLFSGRDFRPFTMQIQGTSSVTKRSEREDFLSSNVDADFRAPLFTSDLMFTVVLNYENNEIENDFSEMSSLREFYSYGAGLTWQVSRNKLLQLTWNNSKKDARAGEDDETESFLGGRINWQFSPRTDLQAQFTKRFFGDAASVSFSHNTRHWRNNVSYSETVTTSSQLLQNDLTSFFACTNGSTSIADCELLDSLDPASLPPDAIFVPFVETNFELSDSVIIRKNAQYTSAVQRRRTNISFSVAQSIDEDIERNLETTTDSIQLTSSIGFSPRTTMRATLRYADVNRVRADEDLNSRINEFSLNIERRFSKSLFASIGYNYLDRSGDAIGSIGGNFGGIDGPLTDNRITASIRYQLSKR